MVENVSEGGKDMRKKIVSLAMALVMVTSVVTVGSTEAKAADASWSLRYIAHAETSANVTSWSKNVVATKVTTTMYVDTVGGGTTVYAGSNSGLAKTYTARGSQSASASVGQKIYATAYYTNYGTSNNFPSGYISY